MPFEDGRRIQGSPWWPQGLGSLFVPFCPWALELLTVSESEEGTEIYKEINHLTLKHLDTLRLQIVLPRYKESACLKAVIVDNSLTSELISQTAQLILVCPSSSRNIIGLNLSAGSKPFKLTFDNRVRYFSKLRHVLDLIIDFPLLMKTFSKKKCL